MITVLISQRCAWEAAAESYIMHEYSQWEKREFKFLSLLNYSDLYLVPFVIYNVSAMSFRPISLVDAKRTQSVTDKTISATTAPAPLGKKIGLYILLNK